MKLQGLGPRAFVADALEPDDDENSTPRNARFRAQNAAVGARRSGVRRGRARRPGAPKDDPVRGGPIGRRDCRRRGVLRLPQRCRHRRARARPIFTSASTPGRSDRWRMSIFSPAAISPASGCCGRSRGTPCRARHDHVSAAGSVVVSEKRGDAIVREVTGAVGLAEGEAGVREVIRVVRRSGPVATRTLSRATGLPVPIVAAIAGELRKRGIVTRERPTRLTEQGRRLFGGATPANTRRRLRRLRRARPAGSTRARAGFRRARANLGGRPADELELTRRSAPPRRSSAARSSFTRPARSKGSGSSC